ncbi:MAG: response regulator [Hyphomicrobiales bacterium]|nr:MAG: response regulator [Hyphomicrobiales bacterium]
MAVVIIDDSLSSLVVLKHLSAAAQTGRIETFTDPRAGLAYLAEHSAELIIVDFVMPHVDGITLVSAVRGNPRHVATPIIMVTQSSEEDLHERAVAAGVDNFMPKPVNLQEYKYVVKACLARDRARQAAAG